jgi:8-oxo-dGTP pyrophosphatase MutT (NUDIX family)
MAFVGPVRYVVVVLHVGGTKLSDVKLVLQREPRSGKTWFPAGSVTANEERVDAGVRELYEETGLILTPDDLTLLSDAHVRVALHVRQQLVYVYSASVHVPYVTAHLRTLARLEQAVTAQSTISPNGSYVVPETIDIGGLNLTPAQTGLLPAMKHKSELPHFGYVTQWETFRRAVYTSQALFHDDTTIPRQYFMYPRFSSVLCGFSFVVTLISCVGRHRPIYEWACLYLRPIWLAYMRPLPRLSAKQLLTRRLSMEQTPVTWRIGSRRNLSAFFCSELRLTLTTQLFGLLHSFLDT